MMRIVFFPVILCLLKEPRLSFASDETSPSSIFSTLKGIRNGLRGKIADCDPELDAAPPFIDPCIALPAEDFVWSQVGNDIDGAFEDGHFGASVSLNADATRVAVGENSGFKLFDRFMLVTTGTIDWTIGGNLGSFFEDYVVSLSLSSDGLHLVAGEQETLGKMNVGKVYVFEYVDDTVFWVQSGNTLNGTAGDEFGRSVDISDDGTIIAVGAPSGKYASIYGLNGLTWELKVLQNSGNFGRSVAISSDGKMAAMGLSDPEDGGPGSVYIYEIGNDALIQTITGDMTGDDFGYSLDFANNGTRIVIGAPSGNYVKIFDFDIPSSTFLVSPATLRATEVNSGYGRVVSVSGNGLTVAVGAPDSDVGGENIGKAFTYLVTNCGESKLIGSFSGEETNDNFGYSVDLSDDGSHVALGAINNEGIYTGISGNFNAGHVRIFKRDLVLFL